MFEKLWKVLRRWRTYLINLVAGIIIAPDVINLLLGFNWATIIPQKYMGYVTLAIAVVNILMRHRLAALPEDPEVQVKEQLAKTDGPARIEVVTPESKTTIIHDAKK